MQPAARPGQRAQVPLPDGYHVAPHRLDGVVKVPAFGFRDHVAKGRLDDLDQTLECLGQPLASLPPLRHVYDQGRVQIQFIGRARDGGTR